MILVDLVDLLAAEDTSGVEVALGHHHISVGLDHVEGALFDEGNHLLAKVQLQRLEVGPLVVVQVLLNNASKSRRQLEFSALTGIDTVTFSQLPNEHGRQIVLVSSEQHVTRGGNTGLEVVRHRGVFTGAHGLEPVVPP